MIGRKHLVLPLPLAAIAACAFQFASPQPAPRPTLVPFKPSGIYRRGERAGWTVTAPEGLTGYTYRLKKNNADLIASGPIDLTTGKATIEATVTEPAMLYLEIAAPGGRPRTYGAAIEPRELRPVADRPKDFDAFWKAKIAGLKAIPENAVLTPADGGDPELDYATIRMDGPGTSHTYGQIAMPKAPGKYPAIALFLWASPPYPLQRGWVTGLAKKGFVVLNIEPHDVLPTEPPAYYQALPAELKNYASIGQDDRERSYFVDMYLRDYRAIDYLVGHPKWDGKTLLAMGTSMGGQQSFAIAGLHPKITHMIVNVPAGADLNAGLHGRQEGYPFFPVGDPKTMAAARYVDAVNFAPHIKATSLVAMGFTDNVAPPAGIWTVFNAIKGPKEAAPMVDSPHNNTATPEQQRPYNDRANAWIDALAKTGKVEVRKDVGKP